MGYRDDSEASRARADAAERHAKEVIEAAEARANRAEQRAARLQWQIDKEELVSREREIEARFGPPEVRRKRRWITLGIAVVLVSVLFAGPTIWRLVIDPLLELLLDDIWGR